MPPRLASKEARELDRLITSLGYWLDRSDGGHLVYVHRSRAPLVVGATPSDRRARAAVVAELRRRHPKAFARKKSKVRKPKQQQSRGERITRQRAVLAASVKQLESRHAPAPARPVRVDRTRCVDCGRPWLSDRPPGWPYGCPGCGGTVVSAPEAA